MRETKLSGRRARPVLCTRRAVNTLRLYFYLQPQIFQIFTLNRLIFVRGSSFVPKLHFLALKSDCPSGIKSRWQPPLLPTGAAQRQSSPVVTRVTNSFPILLTCKLASTGLLERLPYSCVRAFNHPWRPTLPLERGLPSHTRDHFWLSSRPAGCAQSATHSRNNTKEIY